MPSLPVRVALTLTGVGVATAAIVFGVLGRVESTVAYWYAENRAACATGAPYRPAADCIAMETDTVAKVWMESFNNGFGPEDRFYVSVTRASGVLQTVTVNEAVYESTAVGDEARVRVWHGDIVGIQVDGAGYDPGPAVSVSWWGWTVLASEGIGLALWAVLTRRRTRTPDPVGESLALILRWTFLSAMLATALAIALSVHVWWQFVLDGVGLACVIAFSAATWKPEPDD